MNHRGHPKKPIARDSLPLAQMAESFIEITKEEDDALAKSLLVLDAGARNELSGILGRFDLKKKGALDAHQRLHARRVLNRLHRLTGESLTLTNKILDYMDLNNNAIIEEEELLLCVEIMELFARAESNNETLSQRELEMLYAMLRHLDKNNNGILDSNEKEQLRQDLLEPEELLRKRRES